MIRVPGTLAASAALAGMCVAPTSDSTLPLTSAEADSGLARLSVVRAEDGLAWTSYTLRLANASTAALEYRGYDVASPMYRCEVMIDGEWVGDGGGWCGTGLDERRLPPGQAIEFTWHAMDEVAPRPRRIEVAGVRSAPISPPPPFRALGPDAATGPPSLRHVGSRAGTEGAAWWEFELSNPTARPVVFVGEGPRDPSYRGERCHGDRPSDDEGEWREDQGFSGGDWNPRDWELPPRHAVRFCVRPPLGRAWSRVRLRVRIGEGERVLVSDPVAPGR